MRGWQRILLLIFPYFLVVGIFQLVGLLIAGVDYSNVEAAKSSQQHVIVAFFTFLGTFALLWFFIKYVDEEKFVNLGFQIKNRFKDINLGVILGLVIMGVGLLILISLNQVQILKFNVSVMDIVLAILVYIFVAFTEEALFRGYILRNFMDSFNNYVALLASSVLFAVAHGFNPNMDWFSYLNLFLAGILLGATYIYTKNLWFPIALHFSWNLFQTLFGFNVSGQDFYSIIVFTIKDKNMLNGGDFGFEGSIFSIIAQTLLIVIIWYYYERIKPNKIQI